MLAPTHEKFHALIMATQTVELALDARAELGEGPRWHQAERRLYWVDIARNQLHRFDPATGADEVRTFDDPVGCFAFRATGGLILAMKDGLALLDQWEGDPRPFGEQIFADKPELRFNDGRTDPAGRFWVGSVNMPKSARDAALYRADPDGSLHLHRKRHARPATARPSMPTARPSGMPTRPHHELRGYAVDPASRHAVRTGASFAAFRKAVAVPTEARSMPRAPIGRPCSTVAAWCGSQTIGEILMTVELPVTRPTMIVFGGPDLRTAYVTSARMGISDDQLADQPHAGGIFSLPGRCAGSAGSAICRLSDGFSGDLSYVCR